jgi:di/tricarboxylate transporter
MKFLYFIVGMFLVIITGLLAFFSTPIIWLLVGGFIVYIVVDDIFQHKNKPKD